MSDKSPMKLLLLIFTLGSFAFSWAQTTVNLQFQILGSKENEKVFLGYYLGSKSYMKDSAIIDQNGKFHFSYSDLLDEGVYLIVCPSVSYFEFLIDDDQQFEIITKQSDLVGSASIKGSVVNTQFFKYLNKIESFKTLLEKADSDQKKVIDKEFESFQNNFINANKGNLLGKLLMFNQRPNIPENLTDPTEQYNYYKSHFFDFKDFNFKGLVRSQSYHDFLTEYLEKITYQTPDSLIKACDFMLTKTSSNKELFKYTLVSLLNKYASDKTICFDKIYVHIVNQYYANNKASWMNETEESREQLNKIIESSKKLESCLCGNTAFDFKMNERLDQNMRLSTVKATYTVVLFYDPSNSSSATALNYFARNTSTLTEKDVKIVVYPAYNDGSKNAEFIEKNGFDGMINCDISEENLLIETKTFYNIQTTPLIYLLDKDKKIIYKRLSAEQTINVLKSY